MANCTCSRTGVGGGCLDIFSWPVQMNRKSDCTTLGIGVGIGGGGSSSSMDKMLKFYVKVFMPWARRCQAKAILYVNRSCYSHLSFLSSFSLSAAGRQPDIE